MADPETPVEERHRPLIDMQHAAAYGAVALLLFTMLKAYATANFSLTTAAALLTTAPINVLLGSLVSYSYQVFPLIAIGLLGWTALNWRAAGGWPGSSRYGPGASRRAPISPRSVPVCRPPG